MILGMEAILFLVIVLLVGVIFYLAKGRKKEDFSVFQEELKEIRNELKESREKSIESLQGQLQENRKTTEESVKIVKDVTERLVRLDKTNKQVIGFAEQLQSIEDILKNPKQRGILGEYFLEETLKNVLPPGSYKMQYPFKDGTIVDAVVFVKDKIIPIDSKFSLENYNRIISENDIVQKEILVKEFRNDLKKRIDETSKYIRPDEGTMEFAFMFIPSEAIYYDLLVNKIGAVKVDTRSMIEYAFRDKHVIIVSPTSFLAYLQTVLQGLRAMEIEEGAKEIRSNVEKLGKHITAFDSYYKKLGNSMATTVNHYNNGYKEFNKIDKDVVKITEGERTIEPELLDKPKMED